METNSREEYDRVAKVTYERFKNSHFSDLRGEIRSAMRHWMSLPDMDRVDEALDRLFKSEQPPRTA